MMNGVDAFDIDREIVIQVAISFQFPELGGEKIPFAVDVRISINPPSSSEIIKSGRYGSFGNIR